MSDLALFPSPVEGSPPPALLFMFVCTLCFEHEVSSLFTVCHFESFLVQASHQGQFVAVFSLTAS